MTSGAASRRKRLLVTTSRSLLLLDPHSGEQDTVHSGKGLYYGIDVGPHDVLVAARNRMVSSEVPREHERAEILVFSRELTLTDSMTAPFPMRDVHQLRRIGERLYVTCSFDNFVAVHQAGEWTRWYPLGRNLDRTGDVNHFNTIHPIGETIGVVAHNFGPSEILLFEEASLNLLNRLPLGQQAHDLWMEEDALFLCSSAEGSLRSTRGHEVRTGKFPRGVCRSDGVTYVGLSEIAERGMRDLTRGEIVAFDASWSELRRYDLGEVGLVLDINTLE
ncbi:hypothetical protein [Pseudomarimonas salicorniae]|uniref:Sugar lactone lactonase YvrE n=1 Tax=Pseudomarimonas salicorniae TaxID=2933270 RepID=A0ABT0GK90_9GAMM|nr:hypothetical protein [Lysobacter sp. CAU 1642]MCK7594462.1 hypothetical protein [Lysobacter sp. CAU 1642]